MKKIIETADGSHTLYSEKWKENYHSLNGAITESALVFIENGLRYLPSIINPLKILEVGFGTGLNALLSWQEVHSITRRIHYVAIEPEPVEKEIWSRLNYSGFLEGGTQHSAFIDIHEAVWGSPVYIGENFILNKIQLKFQEIELQEGVFNLVYLDAFSYDAHPELWEESIFRKLYAAMSKGGILTTYAAKGEIRRSMQAAGFVVERLPGPPGKREMLRAQKDYGSKK